MLVGSYNESDESFARRLQAQELSHFSIHQPNNGNIDSQTPLMNRPNENPTVINARLNEATTSRATLYAILIVNTPQILASLIVLSMHWHDSIVCDAQHMAKWKLWAVFSGLRLLTYTLVVCFMEYWRGWLQDRRETLERVKNFRNTVDAFGLIWFVVGNMWLFGDDDNRCINPTRSPVYNLCIAMLLINYVQICLPCILAIILIPIMCFCAPCLIRLMARLQDSRANMGASQAVLETLPELILDATHVRQGQENTCPICLSELCIGETGRMLRCTHVFHKQCVDEWLRVNASCPTCRKRILDDRPPSSTSAAAATTSSTSALSSSSSSNGMNPPIVDIPTAPSRTGSTSLNNAEYQLLPSFNSTSTAYSLGRSTTTTNATGRVVSTADHRSDNDFDV